MLGISFWKNYSVNNLNLLDKIINNNNIFRVQSNKVRFKENRIYANCTSIFEEKCAIVTFHSKGPFKLRQKIEQIEDPMRIHIILV